MKLTSLLGLFLLIAHCMGMAVEWHSVNDLDSGIAYAKESIDAQRSQKTIRVTIDTSALSQEDALELCNAIGGLGPGERMLSLGTNHPEGKAMTRFGPTHCDALLHGYEQQSHVWIR
jgi:hypothetical protein